MKPIRQELIEAITAAIRQVAGQSVSAADLEASFQVPKEEKFGDLSTNAALRLAKELKKNPREVAAELVTAIERELTQRQGLKDRIAKIRIEGPGFINFYYSTLEIASVVLKVREEGERFGRPVGLEKRKILLEYVSANPTGPLTVAHGRQAALGDSLARILRFCGHAVTTEYYNNDEGVQINTLGASLYHRVGQLLEVGSVPKDMPENFYQGEYLKNIAAEFIKEKGEQNLKRIVESADAKLVADLGSQCRVYARDTIMKGIVKDLNDFDVIFDNFYSQEELGRSGKVEKTLEELKKRGVTKEEDGALWLVSTAFGDDKDRVLIKSDKTYTYLTPDIAYHHEKYGRGFDTLINILGPDHHGYIARLKASQAALGHDATRLHVLIAQLVTLFEGEKQVRMSTRAGEFVTLREILDEVGRDAGRFFFLMRKFDAHLDFDLELAKSQTVDNPVFYIQYAHARIESVLANCRQNGLEPDWTRPQVLSRLEAEHEIRLMRLLWQYEGAVRGAAEALEPYRVVPYLRDLAAAFHRFYTESRVLTEDLELSQARLLVSIAAQQVLRSGLSLLGVSAPNKM